MTQKSLLHLNGTNGSTVFTDAIGTFTYVASGGATIGTAQSKFGGASLNATGGGDLIQSNTFTAVTTWTADCWVRFDSVAASRDILHLGGPTPFNATGAVMNGNGFGNTYIVSHTGATADGSVTGTKTAWSTATWYHFEMTYDTVAGKYYFYIDGVKDGEITDAVGMSVAGWTVNLGSGSGNPVFGYIDEFRYTNVNEHPGGTTFSVPTVEYIADVNSGTSALTLPVLTLGPAEGGVLGDVASALTLPMLTLAGAGQPYGSYGIAELELPRLTLSATGLVFNTGSASLVLPLLTLYAEDGMAVRENLPLLTLLAEAANGALGSAILTLPSLTLDAAGFAPILYGANNTLPLFTLSATGISGVLATAALRLPSLRLTAAGVVGTSGVMNLILPVLTLNASGYGAIGYAAANSLPMLTLVASGYQAEIGTYRIWALNMHKNALTEYTNFNFNSFANFDGRVLAAGPTGVRVLDTSSLDDATKINASVRWGNLAYGTSFNKRVARAYIGHRSDGYGKFITVTQGQGQREYLLAGNGNTETQLRRIPIGKGPKSTYWQFGYDNQDGSDFAIDSLVLRPDVLRRRVF